MRLTKLAQAADFVSRFTSIHSSCCFWSSVLARRLSAILPPSAPPLPPSSGLMLPSPSPSLPQLRTPFFASHAFETSSQSETLTTYHLTHPTRYRGRVGLGFYWVAHGDGRRRHRVKASSVRGVRAWTLNLESPRVCLPPSHMRP